MTPSPSPSLLARVLACLLVALVLPASPAAAQEAAGEELPDLELSFEGSTARVTGGEPEAEVVFYAVYRRPQGFYSQSGTYASVEVADLEGVARLELSEAVPLKSIWVAVETASGRAVMATPEGFPLRELAVEGRGLARGVDGQLRRLVRRGHRLQVLVARPGEGAWFGGFWDGGEGDADEATDSTVTIDVRDLQPLGASPEAPRALLPDDLVVAVEPRRLEVWARRIDGEEVGP